MFQELTKSILILLMCFIIGSCQKELEPMRQQETTSPPVHENGWIEYHIAKGEQYSDKNPFKSVSVSEMKFLVQFDSSAIYQTTNPDNQADVNKLYGFSDNNQEHHTNSARIGWRWYDNQLQLFGYIYNNTVRSYQLITNIPLGQPINCSIKAEGSLYKFTVNSIQLTMPRASTTTQAVGYQLYPFFGGDELAPHNIKILIKDLH